MQTENVIQHIVDWLAGYSKDAGTSGFVVGVSGGIDSAVTSSLVARTGLPVMCLEMPIHQSPDQVSRARTHIDYVKSNYANVRSECVDLTDVFDSLVTALPNPQTRDQLEMSLANTRARLRMTTLYYFAALNGQLVAGTGNKVEDFGVGFYTKYGDGGVDLSPIADLIKTEVYELGNAMHVIDEILQAPPTDGLWGDDRTDEDQIGASYPELEWAMEFVERNDDESNLTERQKEVLSIYRRYNSANKHKMLPIPVCEIPESLRA
ncbi:MAG: NAD(+) synthase [Gammaproteobacteria bacterium]|nr:NAD(+) synthase [Gammaproteobacteria bacterium]